MTVVNVTNLDAWACSECSTFVLIPSDEGIKGGVCSQQNRGCAGSISKAHPTVLAQCVDAAGRAGVAVQPWLTLRFAGALR